MNHARVRLEEERRVLSAAYSAVLADREMDKRERALMLEQLSRENREVGDALAMLKGWT